MLPHGFREPEQSLDRSLGPCEIVVGVCSVGTSGGAVMGVVCLVSEKEVWAWGMVGASVARVCAWGVPLLLGGVTMQLHAV